MKTAVKLSGLFFASIGSGLLLMIWSFQEAWISATPVPDPEHYRIRAKLLLISSVPAFAGTIVVVFVRRRKAAGNRNDLHL